MMPRFILTLPLLFGCAAGLPVEPHSAVDVNSWCEYTRPATLLISDALGAECIQSFQDAAAFWAHNGVSYLDVQVVPSSSLRADAPPPGAIQAVADPVFDPTDAGESRIARTGTCITAGEIRIRPESCAGNTSAHELGHTLGLGHVWTDDQNLMWFADLPGGFSLTPAQLEHVR